MIVRYKCRISGARFETYSCSDQEGRLHSCPQGKVGSLLLDCKVSVANFQHVWVIASVKVDAIKQE